jgi:hypothetical protein
MVSGRPSCAPSVGTSFQAEALATMRFETLPSHSREVLPIIKPIMCNLGFSGIQVREICAIVHPLGAGAEREALP